MICQSVLSSSDPCGSGHHADRLIARIRMELSPYCEVDLLIPVNLSTTVKDESMIQTDSGS